MTAKKNKDGRGGRQPGGLGKVLRTKPKRPKENPATLLGRFGRYLAMRREFAGLSIRALGRKADIPWSSVFQMESLRKNPRLTELEKLANAFDEPLLWFLRPLLEQDATVSDSGTEPAHVAVQ
jgi:ribosome-binding protein aMBF1 (putative translation factor)